MHALLAMFWLFGAVLAPADEYFGRAHLSVLVIRHRVFALKDDLHHMRVQPGDIEHDADILQDALADWSRRFSDDPWLPAAAWNLATLYEELPGADAQRKAVAELTFVRDRFGGSGFSQVAARDLRRGVGIRPWPHWAAATQPAGPQLFAKTIALLGKSKDEAGVQRDVLAREADFWRLSSNGADPAYARAAWELAAVYERLPGDDARQRAIRLLALLVDRFPAQVYAAWAMRDLERGVGVRGK